ncbi:MAG: Rrf2 family transcriptional regulator [Firmicutes bacterium]|nr:Rrf2 family transcriptional regulator [Bacillota bacterium]
MRLTRPSDYAIRLMMQLAARPGHASDVAPLCREGGIPPAYGAKVVQALARAGLVVTARGARGGVRLSRLPQGISLLEVVEAVEGPTLFTRCMLWPGECPDPGRCALHPVLDGLRRAVTEYLGGISVAQRAALHRQAEHDDGARQGLDPLAGAASG